ncbi:MAG TPA: ATP-binding cassette domain-containing protein, partial [Oscillospiraceae bacterium]|nr:ATP-binding cassette domain-containing protein [Oscillospiraceae bacterium]
MVLQDTWLFSGTIRDNIAYGMPDASLEQVVKAAKSANAHSFIKRLSHGYDTMVDENGENLSLGQRQLITIARAMLLNPPMLILDEATSSVDTLTEQKIQETFVKMMNGRTSFIIAHRLSTIRRADLIIVMNNGAVIEQGTHNELMESGGFYASMYNSQFDEEDNSTS